MLRPSPFIKAWAPGLCRNGRIAGWKARPWKGWHHERDRAGGGDRPQWRDRKLWVAALAYFQRLEALQGVDPGPYRGDGPQDLGQLAEKAVAGPRQCRGDAAEGLAGGGRGHRILVG